MNTKRIAIFSIFFMLPFAIMVAINEVPDNPPRTNKHIDAYCTWHCHNVTCKHWKKSYRENPTPSKKFHKDVFDWYVVSLHNNPLGLDYGSINILVFLVVYPLLGSFLLWSLIRKIY